MNALYHAHSGLRYLVLLVAAAHLVLCLVGLFGKRTPGKPNRILSAALMGLVHTQLLLGLAMVAMGRYHAALLGHLLLMVAAAAVATVFPTVNKKRAAPSYGIALAGTLLVLLLLVLGIMSIGRGPFQTMPFAAW